MDSPQKQIAFKLIDFQISKLTIDNKMLFENKDDGEFELKISFGFIFYDEETETINPLRNYGVNFVLHIENESRGIDLFISAVALFESAEEIDEEFKESNFVKLNSPAIAFPYLRSYITTLTANSGIGHIILPTMNFSNSYDGKKKIPQSKAIKKKLI